MLSKEKYQNEVDALRKEKSKLDEQLGYLDQEKGRIIDMHYPTEIIITCKSVCRLIP